MRAAPGTRQPIRSFALKQKSPSFHRADMDAPAAQLNLATVLIRSTGREAERCQGKMEQLREQTSAAAWGDGQREKGGLHGGDEEWQRG